MTFGTIVKELMKEHGLTQAALAEGIGYSQRAVSKWINHEVEPTESAINRVAEYFKVSADFLLGRTYIPGTSEQNTPQFSVREQQLIANFRELPESSQNLILGMVQSAVDAQKRA